MTRELSCSKKSCVESPDVGHGYVSPQTQAVAHLPATLLKQTSPGVAWTRRSKRRLSG
jgi:hypothetical protein